MDKLPNDLQIFKNTLKEITKYVRETSSYYEGVLQAVLIGGAIGAISSVSNGQ